MAEFKKTLTVEAEQYTGKYDDLSEKLRAVVQPEHGTINCLVPTANGSKLCRPSDYIVKNPKGDDYQVVKQAEFEAMFPKAD